MLESNRLYVYSADTFKENKGKNYTVHWQVQLCYAVVKIGPIRQETQEE